MDHPKEISCRAILENLIKTYGLAHTLSALEYLVGDLNLPDGAGTAQILNEFGLSTLIEVTANLEGVADEIGWLQEIREEESESWRPNLAKPRHQRRTRRSHDRCIE